MSEKISKLTQDLQTTTKEAAGGKSVEASITEALKGVAAAVGKFLGSKYKEAFDGFRAPYDGGYMEAGVASNIRNQIDKSRTGDVMVIAQLKDLRNPTVRVVATFPGAQQYSRELAFKPTESAESVARKLGPAFVRDLDYWMTAVAKAYGEA